MKFNKISIIGVGLIGGSIGMGLKRLHIGPVVGIGRNLEKLKLAKKLDAIDEYTTDFGSGVKDADIVIISTPVETIVPILKKILPYLSCRTTVTDVGSVKHPIMVGIKRIMKNFRGINFVGSHPIAGSEKTGVNNASAELFKNSVCVVCYDKTICSKESYLKIKTFWELLGAKVILLDSKTHDYILARTSHFLHILAYAIVRQINSNKKILNFVGGAYRDMTRIAKSNPELWSNICYMNRNFISKEITSFCKKLEKINKILPDYKKLYKFLSTAYKLKNG